jgi:hypothetical protein
MLFFHFVQGSFPKLVQQITLVHVNDSAGCNTLHSRLPIWFAGKNLLVAEVVADFEISDVVLHGLSFPLNLPRIILNSELHICLLLNHCLVHEFTCSNNVKDF